MSTTNTCVNCGKGEESAGDLKSCTACKLVKYCNRDCQIAHRPQHKKACKKWAAELHDEQLFSEPPSLEDCPICMIPLPLDPGGATFQSCCGKLVCDGCIHAMIMGEIQRGKKNEEVGMCAFCRTLRPSSDEEEAKRLQNLMEKGNAMAYYNLACDYAQGTSGLPQDRAKANELFQKAGAELGCAEAYYNLGIFYNVGLGVEIDKKKAKHYCELAAINGNVIARHNLGCVEYNAGNYHRAYKHYIIATKSGDEVSLDEIKEGFTKGFVTKNEYESTLRAYHESQTEMKSEARDKAADFHARRAGRRGSADEDKDPNEGLATAKYN